MIRRHANDSRTQRFAVEPPDDVTRVTRGIGTHPRRQGWSMCRK
jgi:hypothetical protein